ncbi:hypothetical protein Q8F55_007080 [Vanrija albida]|uniref:C2H2-type domain-containing protein n=1 Tax=Vanrija albida TaxID=181172 RepID=A0ABR3PZN8_9TREE
MRLKQRPKAHKLKPRHSAGRLSVNLNTTLDNNNDTDLRSPSPEPIASASRPSPYSQLFPPASSEHNDASSSARIASPARGALLKATSKTPAADFLRALEARRQSTPVASQDNDSAARSRTRSAENDGATRSHSHSPARPTVAASPLREPPLPSPPRTTIRASDVVQNDDGSIAALTLNITMSATGRQTAAEVSEQPPPASRRAQTPQRTPSPSASPIQNEVQLISLPAESSTSPHQRISPSSGPSSVVRIPNSEPNAEAGPSPSSKGKGKQRTLADWFSEDGRAWRPPVQKNRLVVELPSASPRKVIPPKQMVPLKFMPENRAYVVLNISASRRDELIAKGWYDRFRDDDDLPGIYHQKRGLRAAAAFGSSVMLRPGRGRMYGEVPRQARVREPEALPERFANRPGPAILEPWASVVNEQSLLNRVNEYPCGWKGCDALLATEALLKKHVAFRAHTAQGAFAAGLYGEHTVYRCHWRGCDGPCFDEIWKLVQHMDAVHIGVKLLCPYEGCDLRSPSLHHLQRHVMKQHDEPSDYPHPLANAPFRDEFDEADMAPLPGTAYTHELTTQPISGSWFKEPKQELLRKKVHARCFAPEHPDIFQNHAPLMPDGESDSALPTAEGTEVASEFSARFSAAPEDGRPAKRRRVVVELVRRSPATLRQYARMPLPPVSPPPPADLEPPAPAADADTSFRSAAESDVESVLFADDDLLDSSTFDVD